MRYTDIKPLSEQQLSEIAMSPTSLRSQAKKIDARAGMEFEMIVPVDKSSNGDNEQEPDYDQDTRTRSFSDIYEFFNDGDYNSTRTVQRAIEELEQKFYEDCDEQIDNRWDRDGFDYFVEWVANNIDETQIKDWLGKADDEDYTPGKNDILDYANHLWEDNDSTKHDAYDEFREEQQQDLFDDSGNWLQQNYPYMTDIENHFGLMWPYWANSYNDDDAEADIDAVANSFSKAIGMPVNASRNYHGGRREPGHYVVEPDGSLSPDDESSESGLEFVSPPMPVDEMIDQLKKVKAWAKSYGCYTNDSTGLHINVSVPDFERYKLDYVKLAVLLGDQYVLEKFGRTSNHYCKSAIEKVKNRVQGNPDEAQGLLDKMRNHLDEFASRAIHAPSTDKYTSINVKSNYIEFRSAGGDWLDVNFDQIENTMLRFVVALDAAVKPELHREEYLKKLYKLLAPKGENKDTILYFARYVAGEMPKAALRSFIKQAQLERQLRKPGEGIVVGGRRSNPEGEWILFRQHRRIGDVNQPYDVEVLYRFNAANGKDAGIVQDQYVREYRPDFQVLVSHDPTKHRGQPGDIKNGDTAPAPWRATAGEPQAVGQHADPGTIDLFPELPATAPRRYEIFRRSENNPGVASILSSNDAAALDQLRRYQANNLSGAQFGIRDSETGRELSVPGSTQDVRQQQASGAFTGSWKILNGNGQELYRFGGIGNSQHDANRVAAEWMRRTQYSGLAEVVPVMA